MTPIPMKANPIKNDGPDWVAIAIKAPPTIPTNHTKKTNQPGGVPYFTVARHVRQTCTPFVSSVSQYAQWITSFVLFSILKNPIKFDSYRPVLNWSDLRLFFVKCSKKKRHLSKDFYQTLDFSWSWNCADLTLSQIKDRVLLTLIKPSACATQ